MRKALCIALLTLSALVSAQTTPAKSQANSPANTPVVAPRMMVLENTQSVQFDGSLAQLRGRLQLSDAQLPAWSAFASSVEAYTQVFFSERPQSAWPAETAPLQLERMNARMQKRQLALQGIESQARILYSALMPEQRTTADRYLMASIPVFGFLPPSR